MWGSPFIDAAVTFIEPLPIGLVIALVSAGILRRRESRVADGVREVDPGVPA